MIDLPAGFAPAPSRLAHFAKIPGPAEPGPIARKNAAPAGPAPEIAANDKSNAPARSPAASASKQIDSSPKPAKADGVAVARQAKSDRLALAAPNTGNDITSAIPKPRKAQPGSAWLNPTGVVGFGFAAFVILAMMLFLSRRAKGVHLTAPLTRGLAEGGSPFPGATPQPPDAPSSRPREAASPRPPRARDPDWLPSTLSEALEVLGAGPETGADMLKVIVKRLRRTWHPDHAAHEKDRQTRERRLKQINVAWDIVCGKRRARRRSFTSQEC
jgi:hypothetical protein